jgi:hypothetical protein
MGKLKALIRKWKLHAAVRWAEQYNYSIVRVVNVGDTEYLQVSDGSLRKLAPVKQKKAA